MIRTKCMRDGCGKTTMNELDRPYCCSICHIEDVENSRDRYRKKACEYKKALEKIDIYTTDSIIYRIIDEALK